MKKLILIPLIAIAVALPAIPYHIGTTVEENFRIEHQEASREAALSGIEIELLDYQRGYLDATATSRISIIVPEGEEAPFIDLKHRISHIPQLSERVIATVESELLLSEEASTALAPLFKGEAPLSISTRIFLDGHQEGSFSSPAASGQLADQGSANESVRIEWQGLEATAWQSAARDHITFSMTSPGISVTPLEVAPQASSGGEARAVTVSSSNGTQPKPHSISMGQLRYEAELNRGTSGLWLGSATGSLASFDVNVITDDGSPNSLRLSGATMEGEQSETNGLIRASGTFSAKSLNVDGFELSNAHYDIGLENIDAAALRAWQQTAQQLMQAAGKANTQAEVMNPFAPMLEQLPALVNAQPVFRINDLSVDSPMGRFAIKMDSRINGQWNDALLQSPAMLATMLKADLDASVPRTIVIGALQQQVQNAILMQAAASETELSGEQLAAAVDQAVQQQLAALIGQGFIREKAAQLETHVEYNAGQLLVNGQDASALMGMMMQ